MIFCFVSRFIREQNYVTSITKTLQRNDGSIFICIVLITARLRYGYCSV